MSDPAASNRARAFPDTPAPVVDERAELYPPVGPIPATGWERCGGLVLGTGALLLLAAGSLAYWRWRRTSPNPASSPCDRERAALEGLARQAEDAEVLRKAAPHFRAWIQSRFRLGAAALTTEQVAHRLASVSGIADEMREAALGLLRESDARVFGSVPGPQPAPLVPRMLRWIEQVEAAEKCPDAPRTGSSDTPRSR